MVTFSIVISAFIVSFVAGAITIGIRTVFGRAIECGIVVGAGEHALAVDTDVRCLEEYERGALLLNMCWLSTVM